MSNYDFSRYPSNLFGGQTFTPAQDAARKAVQEAADTWETFITDNFATVPQGTLIDLVNPITDKRDRFPLASSINNALRIYVSSSTSGNSAATFLGNATRKDPLNSDPIIDSATGMVVTGSRNIAGVDYGYLDARRYGLNAEPFVASMRFNESLNFSPSGLISSNSTDIDLYTYALHEFGHALGWFKGAGNIPNSTSAFIYGINTATNSFVGINNSGVIPLDGPPDTAHFAGGFGSNNTVLPNTITGIVISKRTSTASATYPTQIGNPQPDLMVSVLPFGRRAQDLGITDRDLKFLADVGYEIDNSKVTPFLPTFNAVNIPLSAPNPTGNFSGYIIGGTTGIDKLTGGTGNDTLAGGPNADEMIGGLGNDTYYVDNIDDVVTEMANEGNDTIFITTPIAPAGLPAIPNIYDAYFSLVAANTNSTTGKLDPNFDKWRNVELFVDLSDPANIRKRIALSVQNNNKFALADFIKTFPNEVSNNGGYELTSFEGDDDLKGFTDNDIIFAGAGNDKVFGGEGNDTLRGEAGNDLLIGGGGNDLLIGGSSSSFNNFVGFDLGSTTGKPIATANQIDTYSRSSNSANNYVLSYGGVNAYSAGGDYAKIVNWTPQSFNPAKFDRLKVASQATRAVLGIDPSTGQTAVTIVDTDNNNELIAVLQGITSLSDVPAGSSTFGGSFVYDSDVSIFSLVETISESSPTGSSFRISRASAPTSNLTINYIVTIGTGQATINTDFNASFTGSATILANTTFIDIPFTLIKDNLVEGNETISLTLIPDASYSIGILSEATVTIIDDQVNLSVDSILAREDGQTAITLTATNRNPVVGNQTVSINYSGTGITSSDFIGTIPTQITILNGQTSGSVTFIVRDDALIEGDESVTFSISNPSTALTLGSTISQTVNIIDNDIQGGNNTPRLEFSTNTYSINEDGTISTAITVTRTGNTIGNASVTVNLTNGTATAPRDYSNTPIALNFINGQASQTVIVPVILDNINEPTETINLALVNPIGAILGTTSSAVLSINNFLSDGNINLNGNISAQNINTSSTTINGNGGAITLNSSGNITISNLSSYAQPPTGNSGNGGAISINGTNINISGTISTYSATGNGSVGNGGAINLTASNNLDVRAINNFNTGLVNYGNITLTGNEINLNGGVNSVKGNSKNLILQPFLSSQAIKIGGADSGTSTILDITDLDLAALSSGFSSITIGRSNSSGTITINTSSFTSPVTFRTPTGQININSTLAGNLNFIASGITISNGKSLTLGKSEEIIDTANLIFNGATFSLNGFNETLNKLTVSSNSAINFGSGNNILTFSSSSSQTWIGILTINNWTNSKTLKFGTDTTGLTTSQLSKIQFTGFNSGAEINSLGFVTPLAIRGNGILIGTSKNDLIIGGAGNDTLTGGLGDDILNGGLGTDTVKESGDVNFTLTNTTLTGLGTDTLVGIESANLTGGVGNNTLNASAFILGAVTLDGGAGNDSLTGGSQNDILTGGIGNDTINGALGTDTVKESGDINFTLTNTTLIGLGTDTLVGIESANLTGGVGNNTLNALNFTLGSVTLDGGAGNDSLTGGSGNDTLTGGLGNDSLSGGSGIDTVKESGDVNFTLTNTTLTGLGTDTLAGMNSANLTGGVGNNSFNALDFTLGSVTQDGGAGNDVLRGGFANDFLIGGDGNDVLRGAGNNNGVGSIDTLTGNAGNDNFILSDSISVFYNDGNNATSGVGDYALIKDFSSALDKIQLEGVANLYVLGSSPIAGITGTSIYKDTNSNGVFNSTDELIAVVQGSGGLSLGSSYFIYV